MSFAATLLLASLASPAVHGQNAKPYTLQQVLSAPYCTSLTAAPVGNLFAWVEDEQGRHNLWVGGPGREARALTHNLADDAQDIAQLAWSPDGTAIAYTYGAESGADGKPANPAHLQRPTPVQVFLQPLAQGGAPVDVGDGHAPMFSRDGKDLFFVRSGQIWIAPLADAASAHQLVFDRGAASQLTLSPDGSQLAFISDRRESGEPTHSFLALYDLRAHTLRFISPSSSDDSAPVFSPDGHQLAWIRAPFTETREFANPRTSPTPWSIQLADLSTGATTTIFEPAPNKPGSALPHLADSEPRLFFAANDAIDFYSEADGWVHLYEVPAQSNSPVAWLTPGPYEIEDATISHDHQALIYSSNAALSGANAAITGLNEAPAGPSAEPNPDQDRRHLWRVDLTQNDSLPVELTHGDGIETHPQVAPDGTLAAMVSDARTPMHPALIGKDGRITPLHANALPADYPAAALVEPKQVLFDSPDGLHLHGQLFVPEGVHGAAAPAKTRRAAIVFFHGGPERQMLLGFPAMDYYSNAYAMNQYLASRGFIVLSVNYRCGIGYGLRFRQCEHEGAEGAAEYNDALAAANYLHTLHQVDPARIGVWGGSYGGYLSALALARNSNLFAAGVDFHGVHDWNLEDNAADWKQGSAAEKDAIAAKARASSPIADVAHWRSPVLLIHGDNDPDVAYAQTPMLADALRARDVHVEELIFPDEVHGFLLHNDWLTAYTAAAAFFERTLQP